MATLRRSNSGPWFIARGVAASALLGALIPLNAAVAADAQRSPQERFFIEKVAPVLETTCVRCHNSKTRKGRFSLETRRDALKGGDSGLVIVPGSADDSLLTEMISGPEPQMPAKGDPLTDEQVKIIRKWIDDGVAWPLDVKLTERIEKKSSWWSLQPLRRPALPELRQADARWCATPIDRFVVAKLREQGLSPSPRADRRTLIRRVYYDLIGLPPTPRQVEAFVNDNSPDAWAKVVDELLASPRYGERWARHWLDVAHYGDTHGYDKDKPRPNAWPYRDYVIRALNEDKPYARFIEEQVAGDVLHADTVDGLVAPGFLAAGPWDFIGHVELPESKIDGRVARHVDRDDMVRTVMETFTATTVGCAQCHDHKFDPVAMEDYYSLHAVFAGIDRTDREYDADPDVRRKRTELTAALDELRGEQAAIDTVIETKGGKAMADVRAAIKNAQAKRGDAKVHPAYGYHSAIMPSPNHEKWVQVDLGASSPIASIEYVGCWDAFNNIFHGFGFPVRYRIEVSDDPAFKTDVVVLLDRTKEDVSNPGTSPQRIDAGGKAARYVRFTATKLAPRRDDYIFALAELTVIGANGENLSRGKTVTALDSIEAPVRWSQKNLVDGIYFNSDGGGDEPIDLDALKAKEQQIITEALTPQEAMRRASLAAEAARIEKDLRALPAPRKAFVGAVHHGSGNFRGRGGLGPREVHVLHRGNITQPGATALPGTVDFIDGASPRFELSADADEGARRAAMARWLTRKDHPLTWRVIVNRVWLYHFGRGIVDTPSDFGRMGATPTHPELLDWLAVEFRDGGQSLKKLHRMICLSETYQQSSMSRRDAAGVDADNRYLWRFNRQKLDAEAIRDSALMLAGKLDLKMGGPGFQDFVIDKPEHSPHYLYDKADPDDPATHRRSIYRFLVRSQPQPFMNTLDCADPSQMVPKRNDSISALQALTLLNNRFMLCMSEHFASRLEREHADVPARIDAAMRMATGRPPTAQERSLLADFAARHSLADACRLIFNLNEFNFVD